MATDMPIESRPRVSIEHIVLDENGVARLAGRRIAGSRSRVSQIVIDHRQMSPEQIVATYPHLTLGDVHAALAYYYDHQREIDEEIAEGERIYSEALERQKNDPELQSIIQKMRERASRP